MVAAKTLACGIPFGVVFFFEKATAAISLFFFFQAEDGIRDLYVTGVQTCALPIFAFATGRGPDIVCDLEGKRPLVRDGDVAVFACRDADARERRGCQPLPRDMLVLDREHVRQAGAAGAARQAVTFLTRDGGPPDGFWIHLDADVFDETIMQSVDDPRPDGLSWDEGIAVLRTAIASSQAAGLQVAIYNPDIDKDGSNGRELAAAVRSALAG